MSASVDCSRAAELLERFDAGDLAEPEIEALASHLESCAPCGALEAATDRALRDGLRDLPEPLPDEAFFASRLAATMDALAEKPRIAAREPARRAAVVGTIAAGAVLALGAILLLGRGQRSDTGDPASARDGEASDAPVEVVSVDGVDADELAASEDCWLIARYDSLDLQLARDVGLEELTDEELDALETAIGAPQKRGRS